MANALPDENSKGASKTKAKAKAKAKLTPLRAISQSVSPLLIVLREISTIPTAKKIDSRVFIADLWDRVGSKIHMSLPEFKRWLLIQNQDTNGRIALSRADAIGAMDRGLVRRSETKSDTGAEFHFVEER